MNQTKTENISPLASMAGKLTEAAVTIIESASRLTKKANLVDGRIEKDSAVALYTGTAMRAVLRGRDANAVLSALGEHLVRFGPHTGLVLATPPHPYCRLTTVDDYARLSSQRDVALLTAGGKTVMPLITRTRDCFPPPEGIAVTGLDFDLGEVPEHVLDRMEDEGGPTEVLRRVCPELRGVAMLVRPSSSAYLAPAGEVVSNRAVSLHAYLLVNSGLGIEAYAKSVFRRLLIAGYGFIKLAKLPRMLPRTIVDVMASQDVSRLWYEADAILGPGVVYMRRRDPSLLPGGVLDLSAVLPLSAAQEAACEAELARLKLEAEPRLIAAREAWIAENGPVIAAIRKVPVAEGMRRARIVAERFASGEAIVLEEDFPIQLDDGTVTTPFDILADPERYHWQKGKSLDDNRPRRNVTLINARHTPPNPLTGSPAGPWLYSCEHNGVYYLLRSPRAVAERARRLVGQWHVEENRPPMADVLHRYDALWIEEPPVSIADVLRHYDEAEQISAAPSIFNEPTEPAETDGDRRP